MELPWSAETANKTSASHSNRGVTVNADRRPVMTARLPPILKDPERPDLNGPGTTQVDTGVPGEDPMALQKIVPESSKPDEMCSSVSDDLIVFVLFDAPGKSLNFGKQHRIPTQTMTDEPSDSRCIQYPSSGESSDEADVLSESDIAFLDDDTPETDDHAFYFAADQQAAADTVVPINTEPEDRGNEAPQAISHDRLRCPISSNLRIIAKADPDAELTPDQQRVVLYLVMLNSAILIGPGGTGKTKTIVAFCRTHIDPKSVVVVTPTNNQMLPFIDVASVFTTHGFTGSSARGISDRSWLLNSLRKKWGNIVNWKGIRTLIIDEVYFMECWLLDAVLRVKPREVKVVFTGDPLQLTSKTHPAWKSAYYRKIIEGNCGVVVLTQNLRASDPRIDAVVEAANAGRLDGTPEHYRLLKRNAPPPGAVVLTANKRVAAELCEADLKGKAIVKIYAVGTVLRKPAPFCAAVGIKVTLTRAVEGSEGRVVHTGTVGKIVSITASNEPTAKNTKVRVELYNGELLEVGGITSEKFADDGTRLGKLTEIPLQHAAAQTVWAVQVRVCFIAAEGLIPARSAAAAARLVVGATAAQCLTLFGMRAA